MVGAALSEPGVPEPDLLGWVASSESFGVRSSADSADSPDSCGSSG